MTGLYWSTLLKSRAPANIHIIVIRCIFNCCFECFHTAVSFCCFVTERKACNIYLHIHPNTAQQLQVRSAGFEALSSLELHPGGLNYSLALQGHTGQTAVLQAPTLGHYIYIYAFSRSFYLKRLTVHSGCTFFFVSMCVPW